MNLEQLINKQFNKHIVPSLEKKFLKMFKQISETQLQGHQYYLEKLEEQEQLIEPTDFQLSNDNYLQIITGMNTSLKTIRNNNQTLSQQLEEKDQEIEGLERRLDQVLDSQGALISRLVDQNAQEISLREEVSQQSPKTI